MDGMPYLIEKTTDQYSNATYTKLLRTRLTSRTLASVIVRNQHATATLKYKILVSNDETGDVNTFAEEKAEATLAGAAIPIRYVLTGPFVWVEIQIMSNASAESPQASAWVVAVGL
jgi:hypothetical protein